jgi:hypothetical protein
LSTDLAFSGVSRRASVSHNSTEVGITSTARVSKIRASSGSSSRLTVSFQSRTELGMNSRACRQLVPHSPGRDQLTLSQDSLLGRDVCFERGSFEPDLDRGWDLLDSLAEDNLCVFGCLSSAHAQHM